MLILCTIIFIRKLPVNMKRWINKVAVVTGASSGIGAAIAKDLTEAGVRVIGLARRKDNIEEIIRKLPKERQALLTAIKCDVTNLKSVNEAFDEVTDKFGGVDILINNAGCSKMGQMVTMDPQKMQDIVQTNVMGTVYCTQRAFSSMKERNVDGHVVLMNSIVGHNPVLRPSGKEPLLNIYPATKYAITAMNEYYRQEFLALGTKIKVTSLSPGLVDTEAIGDKHRQMYGILSPHDVSDAVLYILGTPPHVRIHQLTIKHVTEIV